MIDNQNWTILRVDDEFWHKRIEEDLKDQAIHEWLVTSVGSELPVINDVVPENRTGYDWYLHFPLIETVKGGNSMTFYYEVQLGFRDAEKAMLFKLTWL